MSPDRSWLGFRLVVLGAEAGVHPVEEYASSKPPSFLLLVLIAGKERPKRASMDVECFEKPFSQRSIRIVILAGVLNCMLTTLSTLGSALSWLNMRPSMRASKCSMYSRTDKINKRNNSEAQGENEREDWQHLSRVGVASDKKGNSGTGHVRRTLGMRPRT